MVTFSHCLGGLSVRWQGANYIFAFLFERRFAYRDHLGTGVRAMVVAKKPASSSKGVLRRPASSTKVGPKKGVPGSGKSAQLKLEIKNSILGENVCSLSEAMPADSLRQAKLNLTAIGILLCCSLCSGTNMLPLVCFAVCTVLGRGHVQDLYHAEKDPAKAAFGNHVAGMFSKLPGKTCCYPDMTKLAGKTSECKSRAHGSDQGSHCEIPGKHTKAKPLLGCVGFCCHNYSKLFQGVGHLSRSEIIDRVLSESDGSTGETCRGLLQHLAEHRLPITVFEQHDEMLAAKNREEWDWFVNALVELGFAADAQLFKSTRFGVPEDRIRTYGVVVEFEELGISHREAASLATSILTMVRGMETDKIRDLKEYLFRSDTDPHLVPQWSRDITPAKLRLNQIRNT